MNMDKTEFIARVRYLGWICFMMGAQEPLHDVPDDYTISDERLESLMQGTAWALNNPNATAEDNHMNWCRAKVEQGYLYGPSIDLNRKTHPSLVPFDDLPIIEQEKDRMDLLMVKLANQLYEMTQQESQQEGKESQQEGKESQREDGAGKVRNKLANKLHNMAESERNDLWESMSKPSTNK